MKNHTSVARTAYAPVLLCVIAMLPQSAARSLADDPQRPPQPTAAEATQLVIDGDRLADQADYSGALERYTQAYHSVVSRIRGQKFTERVLPTLLTRKELGDEMLQMMDKEYTPEELMLMDASYKVFGLMPAETSSKDLITKLLTEEVAGFYDPDKKRMVLIREDSTSNKDPGFLGRLFGAKPAFDKQEQKTTLAHEMTHALQDQLYGLLAMQKRIEKDDDMSLAFSALVEGDATLLMLAEMDGGEDITQMDPDVIRTTFSLMTWMLPVAGGATYRKAPAIFRESLIFPYFQGLVFCVTLSGKRGWPAIHAAYDDPPTSTEQILHPEKYAVANRDEPQLVTIATLKNSVGADWTSLGGNCLGEFQTGVLLRRQRTGRRAATGWDGDRYEVFQHTSGKLAVVHVSAWDSEKDAEEFAQCYTEYRQSLNTDETNQAEREGLDNRTGSKSKVKSPPSTAASETAVRSITRHGDKVWIVDGFGRGEMEAISRVLPECQYATKQFPPKS